MSETFDTPATLTLDASVTSITLTDPQGMPSRVIDTDAGFSIDVAWHLDGTMPLFLGGNWIVRAFVESIGAGYEGPVGASVTVALNGGQDYSATIVVAPNSIPPANAPDTVYKLVVLISHEAVNGQKTEMAGFAEGPFFEVRNP